MQMNAAKGIRDRAAVSRLAQIIEGEGAEAAVAVIRYGSVTEVDQISVANNVTMS